MAVAANTKNPEQNSAQPIERAPQVRDKLAEMSGVSHDSISRAKKVAEQSQSTQRPVGTNQHSEGVHTKSDDVNRHPHGNNATYAERRLRKDRPDLHQRVLDGEMTANAAMIEAGFARIAPP